MACAPYSIADAIPADLDNDGDNDILVGCSGSLELAWYENLGDGTFSFAIKVQNSESSVPCVEAADLDGDGDLDVIAGSSGGDRLSWYENLGGADSFGVRQEITNLTNSPKDVEAADLDGDGDIDLVSASRVDDEVAWYENLGGGSFGPQQILSDTAMEAEQVRLSLIHI